MDLAQFEVRSPSVVAVWMLLEMCQLIDRQVGGCHHGGYTPFETPRADTNLHTHTHTHTEKQVHALLSVGGIHLIKGY